MLSVYLCDRGYYGIKYAGTIFSLGYVLVILYSINTYTQEIWITDKLLDEYYMVLLGLVIGVLFASRYVIIINAVLIIASVIRINIVAQSYQTEVSELANTAMFNHIFAVIFISIIVVVSKHFTDKAIMQAKEDGKIKEEQNKRLNEVFALITETSDTLNNLSIDINSSARRLTSNSSDQASNIEEISATIEEITTIIVQNSGQIQDTTTAIDHSKLYQETIQSEIESINKIMIQIAKATQEQKAGADQINSSIADINTGAQNNAAISEQLSENVNLLSEKAERLGKLVHSQSSL